MENTHEASTTPTHTDTDTTIEDAAAALAERRTKASTLTSKTPDLERAMRALFDVEGEIGATSNARTREAYLEDVERILNTIRRHTSWSSASDWRHVDDEGCGYAWLAIDVDVADVHVFRGELWRRFGHVGSKATEDLIGRPRNDLRRACGWVEYNRDAESDGRAEVVKDLAKFFETVLMRGYSWAFRTEDPGETELLEEATAALVRRAAHREVESWDIPEVPPPSERTLWRALLDVPGGAGILRAGYAFDARLVALRGDDESSDPYAIRYDVLDGPEDRAYLVRDFIRHVHGDEFDDMTPRQVEELRESVDGWVRATIDRAMGVAK